VSNVPVGALPRDDPEMCSNAKQALVSDLSDIFGMCGPIDQISVSTRGHAFVKFSSAAGVNAALAPGRTFTLRGATLRVQARGDSQVHHLRRHLQGNGLPHVERAGDTVYWTLSDAVGGGLVAAPASKEGLRAARETLAGETLTFLKHKASKQGNLSQRSLVKRPTGDAAGEPSLSPTVQALPSRTSAPSPSPLSVAAFDKHDIERVEVEEVEVQKAEEGAVADDADKPAVRNVCVIAHVDHGKTTLSDCLLSAAGLLSSERAGRACALDTGLEQERGITINAAVVSLSYTSGPTCPEDLRLSLLDCPGHAEFNSEVTASLRLSDGALLVVDVQEGVRAQTEVVLRQALMEGVRPVLVLNKVDRLLPVQRRRGEDGDPLPVDEAPLIEIHAHMRRVIAQVNALIAHSNTGPQPYPPLSLAAGTVLWGSGFQGWIASVDTLADLYAARAARAAEAIGAGVAEAEAEGERTRAKAMRRLADADSERGAKAFVQMALRPVAELHAIAGEGDVGALDVRLQGVLGRGLPEGLLTRAKSPDPPSAKDLRRAALGKLLPAARCILATALSRLPSPTESQRARAQQLCPRPSPEEGDQAAEDSTAPDARAAEVDAQTSAVAACASKGPLVAFVSKVVPMAGSSKAHAAVARVLSGTISPGTDVWVVDDTSASPAAGAKGTLVSASAARQARVTRVLRFTPSGVAGAHASGAQCARAGEVVGLLGLEGALGRSATLGQASLPAPLPLAPLAFEVSVVERRAVSLPAGGVGARKLAEAMPTLQRADPLVRCGYDTETCEQVIGGSGELHLEVCVERLRELLGPQLGPQLVVTPAAVAHREGVAARSPQPLLAKSSNKLNRFWAIASPLGEDLARALETGVVPVARADATARARALVANHGWDRKDAARILGLSPEGAPTNALVDCTVGVQGMDLVKDLLADAFAQVCAQGPLAGQRLRGVRIDITDALVHAVAASRRAGQIVPAATRAFSAAILAASPSLLEPVSIVRLSVPLRDVGQVYSELTGERRAESVTHTQAADASAHCADAADELCHVTAAVPTTQTTGLSEVLRGSLRGSARGLKVDFSHWAPLDEDIVGPAVEHLRSHRGMPRAVPTPESLSDRL